jgi:uncharacterized protein YggE
MMRRWMTPLVLAGGVTLGAIAASTLGGPVNDSALPKLARAADEPTLTSGGPMTPVRTVTVTGTGTVTGRPDLVTIQLGVQATDSKAVGALRKASSSAEKLIATLKSAGVADDDLTTTNVSVWPQYDTNYQRITGYQASNDLIVKLRDLARAGEVIDLAAESVGDDVRMNGIAFSINDTGALMSSARKGAVGDARQHADELATAAGAKVGKVMRIDESVTGSNPPPIMYADAAASSKSVPLQAGTQDVQVQVTITYELTD